MNNEMRDKWIIFAASFFRSISIGMIGVLLAIYLTKVGLTKVQIGFVVSVGLIGATFGTLLVTYLGDFVGRRNTLIIYALLSAIGGVTVCLSTDFYAILVAAFLGMMNARGKDRGAALVMESAILPSLDENKNRTTVFALYYIIQDLGLGVGAFLAGLPTLLSLYFNFPDLFAFQFSFGIYALLMLLCAGLYWVLSNTSEISVKAIKVPFSAKGKKIVTRFSFLYGIDGLAGGFLTKTLLAFYFYERFGVNVEALGILFLIAHCLNAVSHLVSSWVAKLIGLVNTMVFTHSISHIFLVLIAFAPTFPLAVTFYLLRESLSKMEGPTKRSYMMGVIEPEDRTRVNGITSMIRMLGWAVAPTFAGFIMQEVSLASPLFIGAGMKLLYDILIFISFKKIRPPEEEHRVSQTSLSPDIRSA